MSDQPPYPPLPPNEPLPNGPWDPVALDPPQIILWFKIYMVVLVLLHLVLVVIGFMLGGMAPDIAADPSEVAGLRFMGLLYVLWGLCLGTAFGATLLLPTKPWVWIFNLVALCISIFSGCCFLIPVIIIIFWVNQDVRRWYGME